MQRRDMIKLAVCSAMLAAPRIGHSQAAAPLRFVPDGDVPVLDPITSTSNQTRDHAFMVFDTLYGQDNASRTRPQMVEGHVCEDDNLTWKLTLRPGLAFHDGSKVLARDAVASVARWARRDSFGQALMAQVNELSAPDDRTIRFRLKTPFPMLPEALGHYSANMCAIMPARLAETDASKPITEMVGSGPFRYKADERVPGSVLVYEKFAGYVPRNEPAERTAGGKVVHFDRVEWRISPDMATTASALMAGELDFWTPPADLVPLLRKSRNVMLRTMLPAGYCAVMVFNQLYPPFDNPAIRRAVLHAARQSDFMNAVLGDDRTGWRDDVGYFCPQTPMASSAGLEAMAGPQDLGAARKALEQGGYRGERVRLLMPTDNPKFQALAEVGADLLKKLGFNLDVQSMDWATVTTRRIKQEPLDQGGWSVFLTAPLGTDLFNPAVHPYLRTSGRRGSIGWSTSPRIEELRAAWLAAGDEAAQAKVAEQLQLQAFQDVPYVPLGQWFGPTAYRTNLQGMLTGLPLFWNIRRS